MTVWSMAEENVKRKLTAILYADVAGYSRLTGEDEVGTHRRLSAGLDLISDEIKGKGGKVVHYAGDAVLADFSSVVAAVECAVGIQRQLSGGNAGVPDDKCLQFRIGVNLGEVIVDRDDIYGDGVNVAARLESLAEAGGICVSGAVFEQVNGKLDVGFQDMGSQEVKNIAQPVRAYRVVLETTSAFDKPPPLPEKPSIAVLPFNNLSSDPEQEYFADGMTEDIITSLSKLSQLLVIARNSSFTYKGRTVKVPEIAKELGVTYVIEGSVRKIGDRVRITAQLIDGGDGGHLWAERFDRDLTDIFAMQDEVTEKIVAAMDVKLTGDERNRLKTTGTNIPEAYDYVLRSREQTRLMSKDGNARAQALLNRAIELDPGYATAYANLAMTRLMNYLNRWSETADPSLEYAYELAQKAVALDGTDPTAHHMMGLICLWKRQHDQAIAELERSIALEPNRAYTFGVLGNALQYAGRPEEALEWINRGMRLDPGYSDSRLHFLALATFQLGRYEDATEILRRRIILKPDTDISRVLLAACYGHLGLTDEAKIQWAEVFRINPDYSLERHMKNLPYKDPANTDRIVEGLRKAGLVE
jgi:adenylate cyclase